jgi:hypothetical protein
LDKRNPTAYKKIDNTSEYDYYWTGQQAADYKNIKITKTRLGDGDAVLNTDVGMAGNRRPGVESIQPMASKLERLSDIKNNAVDNLAATQLPPAQPSMAATKPGDEVKNYTFSYNIPVTNGDGSVSGRRMKIDFTAQSISSIMNQES